MKNRKSIRLKGYDYTSSGAYFVTISTKDKIHYFGTIINDGPMNKSYMNLNVLGQKCYDDIPKITDHYPFVDIHEFIVMPNHIHLLLVIGDNDKNIKIETKSKEQKQPKSGSLSAIIRGFKIGITNYSNENGINFERQSRFHDHIIRTQTEYDRISHYIKTNPENWQTDCYG